MSPFSIQTRNLFQLPTGSAPGRSKMGVRGRSWPAGLIAILLCGLFFISTPALAEKELLNQTLTVNSTNGGGVNLFTPGPGTLHLDYNIESGKEILLMIITEDQWNAASTGEKLTGAPVLRTTVSGNGSATANLDRGTYTVFLESTEGTAQVTLRAWAD